jgi:hypothetical protein
MQVWGDRLFIASYEGSGFGTRGITRVPASPEDVRSIQQFNGSLWVGGDFPYSRLGATQPGDRAHNLTRLNASGWSPLAVNSFNGRVRGFRAGDDSLLAFGDFGRVGSVVAPCVARNVGGSWSAVGIDPGASVGDAIEFQGSVYIGGRFPAGANGFASYMRWNGAAWEPMQFMPSGTYRYGSFAGVYAGRLVAVRGMTVETWDGSAWQTLGSIAGGNIYDSMVTSSGRVIVAGNFSAIAGVPVSSIAAYDADGWSSLPGATFSGNINAITEFRGEIIAAGSMTVSTPSGTFFDVVRHDGTEWHYTTPPDAPGFPQDVCVHEGTLVVEYQDNSPWVPVRTTLTRWDGTSWEFIEGLGLSTSPDAWMSAMDSFGGELFVAGGFDTVDGQPSAVFARWSDECLCDSIDFNRDMLLPDTLDIADFLSVFAGGVCDGQSPGDPPCNADVDFNNDSMWPDLGDVQSLIRVFAGGDC